MECFNRDGTENEKSLSPLLIEGYQATRAEDIMITKEFEQADFENYPEIG